MRHLGIDFGTKQLGLALSDPEGRMAFPLDTLEKTTRQKLFDDLLAVIAEHGVEAVVVGLPLALDGGETLTTRQARNFAESLGRRCGLPVHLHQEALSTEEAREVLRAAGRRNAKQSGALDQQAAVVILSSFLETLNRDGS
jgi:putative Holliday junction resolvase